MQEREHSVSNETIQILSYVDDIDLLGEDAVTVKENAEALIEVSKDIGLECSIEYIGIAVHQELQYSLLLGRPNVCEFLANLDTLQAQRPTAGLLGHRSTAGLLGLRNIGNTCFLNSIVQCLANTELLRDYLIDKRYLKDIQSESRGDVIRAFANLLQDIWSGDKQDADPTHFKCQIQRFAPRFTGYSQQDAQEFLRYLLEGLHQDVNQVTAKQRRPLPELSDELPDAQKASESWKQYLTLEKSYVVELFVGQLKSTLTFANCGHRSTTFEVFWDISLPLPQSTTSQLQLSDCFDHFMQDETLDGDNMAKCTRCNARRSCTKRYSIHKFPRILVVHLKRFSPTERFRKLTANVNFPVQSLDLAPYSDNTYDSGDQMDDMCYDLYAVSNHSGTTQSGHYTAACRHPKTQHWHWFNDRHVSPMSSSQVVTPEAYVLFYEQRQSNNRDNYDLPPDDQTSS